MSYFHKLSIKDYIKLNCPNEILSHPSMMSKDEKRLLYGIAKEYYTGSGVIIDAGIFLGASTLCFARGLQSNLNYKKNIKSKIIWSYDLCQVNNGILRQFQRPQISEFLTGYNYKVGESFEPLLKKMLSNASIDEIVDLKIGNILESRFPSELSIEVAFFDILKTKKIEEHVFREFYPKFIPGVTLLIQQDYFFHKLPYIKIRQEYLTEYFDYLGEVGPSAIFLLKSELADNFFLEDPASTLPLDHRLYLLDQAAARSQDPARKALTALSKVEIVKIELGSIPAKRILNQIIKEHHYAFSSDRKHENKLSSFLQKVLRRVEKMIHIDN